MGAVLHIKSLEELARLINEDGFGEIVSRLKNGAFKKFQKIVVDQAPEKEVKQELQKIFGALAKGTENSQKALNMLGNVAKLNQFNLVLNGANLCATCAGFAIMCEKLDGLGSQIAEIEKLIKKIEAIHSDVEFNKTRQHHADMLDCRKKQRPYSETEMRQLVTEEYTVLRLLMKQFSAQVTSDQETLIFSILSMASMLAASIRFFDETYYFNNKELIQNGEVWHSSHDEWVAVFNQLSDPDFVEKIQDYGIFELNLTTVETDCFYISFLDQVKGLRQEIEDNQSLLLGMDNRELFNEYDVLLRSETQAEIENAIVAAGKSVDDFAAAIHAAVA